MRFLIAATVLVALCITVTAGYEHGMGPHGGHGPHHGHGEGHEHHKKCCGSCRSNYPTNHHLRHSCLRGCRLYSMIYLAHDKSIPDTELSTMCSNSCQNGFSGMLGGADGNRACLTGCREQERVFKEHGLDDHGAKMSIVHGLGVTPEMQSAAPFHHRIFQHMRELHERMLKAMVNAKHAVIQHIQIRIHSLPPGPDGKPRYQVEIHQQRMPFAFNNPGLPFNKGPAGASPSQPTPTRKLIGAGEHDKMTHRGGDAKEDLGGYLIHIDDGHGQVIKMTHRGRHEGHRGSFLDKVRHFFADMSEPAKAALRWSLFGLLLASVLCLGWLCCRTCRISAANAAAANGNNPAMLEKPRLSLTQAFIKKKPGVQSGDIFYVDVSDKKPLIDSDEKKEHEDA